MTAAEDPVESRRGFRHRRLRLAAATSLLSKGIGLVLQLVAVPLAIGALGAERFGVYTMLVSVLVWIDLGAFGMGPGLTRKIAVAWNSGDIAAEGRYFSSAIAILLLICLVLSAVFATGMLVVFRGGLSLAPLFGPAGDALRGEIHGALLVIATFFLAQLLFSCGERARSAYQEDYLNNAMYVVANCISLVLMFMIARHWPTIPGFALAVFGALTLVKGLNMVLLVAASRPYLFPRFSNVDRATARELVGNGAPFWLIQAASLSMHNFSLVLLGVIAGPDVLAPFAAVFRLFQLLATGVTMLTQPLWPSVTDACVRGDFAWIRRVYVRAIAYVMLYCSGVFLVFALAGDWLIRSWLKGHIAVDHTLVVGMAAYFAVWMWNNLHTSLFFGLGWLWQAAFCLLLEGACVLLVGGFLARSYGALGTLDGLLAGGALVSAWVLPLLLRTGKFGQRWAEKKD